MVSIRLTLLKAKRRLMSKVAAKPKVIEPTLHPYVAHRLKFAGFRDDYAKASYDILIQQSHEAQLPQIRLLEELWHDDVGFAHSATLPTPSCIMKELPSVEYKVDAIDAGIQELPEQWREHFSDVVRELPFNLQELQLKEIAKIVKEAGGCLPSPVLTFPPAVNPILEVENPIDHPISTPNSPPSTPFRPLARTPRLRNLTGQPKRGHFGTKIGTIPPPIPSLPAQLGAISVSLYQPVQRTSSKPTVLGASQVINRPTPVSGRWTSKQDSFAVDDDPDFEDAGYHWSRTDSVSYDHFSQGLYGCYALFEGTTAIEQTEGWDRRYTILDGTTAMALGWD